MDIRLLVLMLTACFCRSIKSSENLLKHKTDPQWCFELRPDCNIPYVNQHCNELCESNHGKCTYTHGSGFLCNKTYRNIYYIFNFSLLTVSKVDLETEALPAYPKLLKEKLAPKNVLASSHVKFHKNLHPIEWRTVAKSSIPSLNQDRIDYIMSIAGAYSLNPLILITMLAMNGDLMKIPTNNEFNQRFREMSENMARTHLEGQDDSMYNTLNATIQQLYQDDETKLQNFHNIYSKLHTGLNIPVISQSETLMLNERDEELQPSLSWPWRQGECWEIGPSHGGSVEGLDVGYVPSSLDMGPSLYISWNHDYKFLGMDGSVVASHTGHVYIHSTCSVEITAGRYSTYYAHIKVRKNSTNDHFVKQGGLIFFLFLYQGIEEFDKRPFCKARGRHWYNRIST